MLSMIRARGTSFSPQNNIILEAHDFVSIEFLKMPSFTGLAAMLI